MESVHSRLRQCKTKRGRRELEKRLPKTVEDIKNCMIIRGARTSDVVQKLMRDLSLIKKPDCVTLSRKNDFLPFEDMTPIERFGAKFDAGLFVFGNHCKKRPHNLTFGRLFQYSLYDLVECGITRYQEMRTSSNAPAIASKPALIFLGQWEEGIHASLKTLFMDIFRGHLVTSINIAGIDHAWVFVARPGAVMVRHYSVAQHASGGPAPTVQLSELGPNFDLEIRRDRQPSSDLVKIATYKKKTKKARQKNLGTNVFGETVGTVHIQRQDFAKLASQTKLPKALRKRGAEVRNAQGTKRPRADPEAEADAEAEVQQ